MRIAGRHLLDAFSRKHADARIWVENWVADVGSSIWVAPIDVKSSYSNASFLANGVVIFNVKGNTYRLETVIVYRTGVIVVSWVGTHAAYDVRNRKRRRRK